MGKVGAVVADVEDYLVGEKVFVDEFEGEAVGDGFDDDFCFLRGVWTT